MSNSDDTSASAKATADKPASAPSLPVEGALAVAPASAEAPAGKPQTAAEGSSAPTLSVVPNPAPAAPVATVPAPQEGPPAGPLAEEGPLYPTVVFAVEKGFPQAQVEKQFSDEGMTLIFAKTEEDVTKYVARPETYVVFVGIEFAKNGIMLMRKLMVQSQAYWVMVTGHLSTQKRSQLLNAGAVDLLVHPVGAAQYKLRAKGLLGRYLKAYELPKEVILPQGFHRKEDAAARGEGGNNNANAEKGYSHRSGEGGKDAQQGYGHRSGDAAEKTEMRMHDLSRDKEGPGYKHHSSKDDPSNPEWRNKITADEEGPEWRNKVSADDPSNPAWRQHSSERLQQEAEAKRIAAEQEKAAAWKSHAGADEKPADWKNHASATDKPAEWRNNAVGPDGKPVEWRGGGKQAAADQPPDWKNSNTPNGAPVRGASSVVSMTKPESKDFSAVQEAAPDAPWRNNASAPDTAAPFRRLEGETDAQYAERMAATQPQHRSGDMAAGADRSPEAEANLRANEAKAAGEAAAAAAKKAVPTGPLKEIHEPRSLLEAIRAKIVLLGTDTPWDPKIWKDLQPLVASQFQGMDRSLADLSKLFRDACAILGAKRITLVSFRPALLLESFPEEVVALVSSDADPRHNEQVASQLFPQLRVSYEEAAPFLLDETLPAEIGGKRRPETWCIDGHNEKMAALLPVISDRKVAMSLFIQFDRSGSPEVHKLLEQAVTYFREPEKHYNLLDFISRVYREAK